MGSQETEEYSLPNQTVNGIRLAYEWQGPEDGPVLVLIQGLSMPLIAWPPTFVTHFTDAGYRVLTLDNRDIGLSHHHTGEKPPKILRQILLRRIGIRSKTPYDLRDMAKEADYTYELADAYTISLEFFDGPARTGDYVLFADNLDISQRLGGNAKHDYKTKLLVYLASRIKWDRPEDGQYLSISKRYLFKNLDLLGRNSSRNNQIFWRTVEELREEGYLIGAQELPGKKKSAIIQFQINSEQLRAVGATLD